MSQAIVDTENANPNIRAKNITSKTIKIPNNELLLGSSDSGTFLIAQIIDQIVIPSGITALINILNVIFYTSPASIFQDQIEPPKTLFQHVFCPN